MNENGLTNNNDYINYFLTGSNTRKQKLSVQKINSF